MQCTGFLSVLLITRNSKLLFLGNKLPLLPHDAPERIRRVSTGWVWICVTLWPFQPFVCLSPFYSLYAILHCVQSSVLLYHHHLQLRCLAAHLSHLAMQYCSASFEMMCGSKCNLIDFDGLKVAQTDIYSISPKQCNVPMAICFCHLELMHRK